MTRLRGGDQVLQLSLTELAFSIAFLLLMLLGVRVAQSQAERDAASAALAAAPGASAAAAALARSRAELESELHRAGAGDPSAALTRLVEASALRAERDQLRQRVRDLDVRLSALEAARAHDSPMRPAQGGFDARAGAAEPRGLPASAAADDPRVQDLRGQVAFLTQRLAAVPGHGGRDFPPCWADERGQVEFLFAVELRPGAFVLTPAWPPARDAQARALPGVPELLRGPLEADAFSQRVQPLVQWSRNRTPECRHYVQLRSTIADAVQSDRARLLVERYFYKSELPR